MSDDNGPSRARSCSYEDCEYSRAKWFCGDFRYAYDIDAARRCPCFDWFFTYSISGTAARTHLDIARPLSEADRAAIESQRPTFDGSKHWSIHYRLEFDGVVEMFCWKGYVQLLERRSYDKVKKYLGLPLERLFARPGTMQASVAYAPDDEALVDTGPLMDFGNDGFRALTPSIITTLRTVSIANGTVDRD